MIRISYEIMGQFSWNDLSSDSRAIFSPPLSLTLRYFFNSLQFHTFYPVPFVKSAIAAHWLLDALEYIKQRLDMPRLLRRFNMIDEGVSTKQGGASGVRL